MGRIHSNHRTGHRTALAAVAGTLALAACGGDDDSARDLAATQGAPVTVLAEQAGQLALDSATATAAAPTATLPGSGGGVDTGSTADVALGSIGRDVIVELHVQMESDDIARTVAAITADAVTAGGGVASSDISYGTVNADGEPNRDGHAVVVLKVPPAEVADVVANLDGTGRVLAMNQSAQDVTDQLIDLDVRIDNKRTSVANVRKMMEQTTDLTQLVALESELTARQTELEQLEAQQRNLGDRVALSTITVEIRPTATVAPEPLADDGDSIGDSFAAGWDAFTGTLLAIGFVLAAVSPFVVAGLVLAFVGWVVARIRNRPPRAVPDAPAVPAASDDQLTKV